MRDIIYLFFVFSPLINAVTLMALGASVLKVNAQERFIWRTLIFAPLFVFFIGALATALMVLIDIDQNNIYNFVLTCLIFVAYLIAFILVIIALCRLLWLRKHILQALLTMAVIIATTYAYVAFVVLQVNF